MLRALPTLNEIMRDPREAPRYTAAEVALYIQVPKSTLGYWTRDAPNAPALIKRNGASFGDRDLSFMNLLEAHVLEATRQRGVPLRRLRKAVAYLQDDSLVAVPHPLLAWTLHTVDGSRDVFVKAVAGEDPVNASRHGQVAFGALLDRYLKRIEVDQSGDPIALNPMHTARVALKMNVSAGQPVIKGTGITVRMIAGRYRAGESKAQIAKAYDLKIADINAALTYLSPAA